MLSEKNKARYARQTALPQIGESGQEKICAASVLIIGAGGLGSPVSMYLAAAGVGRIGIVDNDCVSLSNLQRQILHGDTNIGQLKTQSASDTLKKINPECIVEQHPYMFTSDNAGKIIDKYDVIIDASDNFETKLLAADTSCKMGKPFIYGGINAFQGQIMSVPPHGKPCLRCLLRYLPPTSKIIGPFGATAGTAGSIQSSEAIKFITGLPVEPGLLISFDSLAPSFRTIKIKPNISCKICGTK